MINNTKKYQRIFLIVTDSLGIGDDVRAKEFGDEGANTFLAISKTGLLEIPTLLKLGINTIAKLDGHPKKVKNQKAYTARVEIASNAKDTLAGHWEMMGIKTIKPYPAFPKAIDLGLLKVMEKEFGRKIVGRKGWSGTEVIKKYAKDEIEDNKLIVYGSEDSTIQICAHEEYTPIEELYRMCERTREICNSKPEWKVGRVIARPYIGANGVWTRTANRRDYVINLPQKTILDDLMAKGVDVYGIGKIVDIFNNQGISRSIHTESDDNGMDLTIEEATKNGKNQFVFVNLVDFDTKYGHRRDPEGYAENTNRFDIKLAKLLNALKQTDLLILTSDHGNDPTMPGSGHTRELVPLTIYSKSFENKPIKLDDIKGIGVVGNIVAHNFGVKLTPIAPDIFDLIK